MDVVAAFDNWVDALTVYRNNFSHPAIRADLMNVGESVKAIRPYNPDMIIGGPPCQDFLQQESVMRIMGVVTLRCVMRNRIRNQTQVVCYGNVERILKTQKLQDALQVFHSAGYGVTYTVLNAALCGVPQKRKRFVMVGKLGEADDS